jgi:hypothetical protein
MSYRCFAQADEAISDQWSRETSTTESWTLGGPIGSGESASSHVLSSSGRRGAGKPAHATDGTPRAAHEKIASDLAYHLGLPVPAVCLWTNPTDGARYAVSVWAFSQALTWADMIPKLTAPFLQNAGKVFSAARVFQTWIADSDHNGNGGNVLWT